MSSSTPKSIALITMSTRSPRVGPHVVDFVTETISPLITPEDNMTLAPVDLATFKLPVYDEAVIPAMVPSQATFSNKHSIAWSDEIKRHDGYIIVTGEYNYGIPGGTKNAVDYLVNEWMGKPVVVISYGVSGGNLANNALSSILEKMKLRVAATRPELPFAGGKGPDLFAAMLKGELGEESKKLWEEEKSEEVKKAFGELKVLLEEEEKDLKPE
ncbi:flavoprotein-like protein [Apodospora peruviana]|uniref:Flavoprotein-like protein n=1 Tax=Apodospora peruviana TaxID=516989 RepID=A0AAE0M8K4_9PEZI|nr:flavoprotein-like protein [Apodospora peruviana]